MQDQWTAEMAISSSVLLVSADMRLKDLEQHSTEQWPEAYAVFSDMIDSIPTDQFLGIVPQYLVSQYPYRIFADLLPLSKSSQVAPATPLDILYSQFQSHKSDAFSVIGTRQQFLGAVTQASLWKTLFQREQHLSAKLRREIHDNRLVVQQLQNVSTALTDHREKQKELQLMHAQQLTTISKNLLVAEKRQRQELAIELHDHLAQLLAVGRIKVAQASSLTNIADLSSLLKGLDQLLEESLTYTRDLMRELNPSQLPESGLQASLEALTLKMKQYNLDVILEVHETFQLLSENQTFNLYWSIRELLFNVVKHAEVNRATIAVKVHDHNLRFTISDLGKGFTQQVPDRKSSSSKHLGLYLIRERMTAIDGTMTVYSSPGKGTEVQLTIPCSTTSPSI